MLNSEQDCSVFIANISVTDKSLQWVSGVGYILAGILPFLEPCGILYAVVLDSVISLIGCVNASPPSATYMLQWIESALAQVMAYRLIGAKQLSKLMLVHCLLGPQEQTSFIHDNASENIVCEMAAILSRRILVNLMVYSSHPAPRLWQRHKSK